MKTRRFGKTGWQISEVSLGTWQVGGKWGAPFDAASADAVLGAALDAGVNFIDTADVYSAGLSEQAVGRAVRSRSNRIYVATKCGRRLTPHVAAGYTRENLTRFVDESLARLGLDVIDLIQLHCPPLEVIQAEQAFEALDGLQQLGKIRHYGVSVETVEEALTALTQPGVVSVQIIFNMMRQKPAERFLALASAADVGVIARVPLASGLLTGQLSRASQFGPDDHRTFNRHGEVFDRGETFSGVDFELGLRIVEDCYVPLFGRTDLAQWALRWVLMFQEVSTVIPGASTPAQVVQNLKAAELEPISPEKMQAIAEAYDQSLRALVHDHW